MDIWFIDIENVGSPLLEQLPVGPSQHCRFMVFSRSCSRSRKWTARYPLHARLFDDYEIGKNQADFYMVSVLTQVLGSEPDTHKRIMLLTQDQDLILAFKALCNRFQVEIMLIVGSESAQLPDPKIAQNSSIKVQSLHALAPEDNHVRKKQNTPTAESKVVVTPIHTAEKNAATKKKNMGGKAVKVAQKKILKALKKHPLTIHEMISLLGLSFSEIQEVTNPLIKNNSILRVNKTGKKWQLAKQSA